MVSPDTVRTHVSRAMVKLHARDRAQLVVFAIESRLGPSWGSRLDPGPAPGQTSSVLLPPKVAQGVRDGSITLAFRRWPRQDVRPGSEFRTAGGVVRVDEVTVVDADAITNEEAVLAGHPDADVLRTRLRSDPSLPTYRVVLAWAGEDPRIALRESADLTDDDVAAIDARLDRLDRASSHGAWTMATLDIIRRRPHTRAPDLAEELGRERDPFKIDVRKLKNLGLTQSFDVGYAVSPRGKAYLARTSRG